MDSTEQDQLMQSNATSHYYSGHKYYNIQNEIIENTTRYGSFTANNHKHYKNKQLSKSNPNLLDLSNPSSHESATHTHTLTLNDLSLQQSNVPFSQYTPNPYYSIVPNHSLSSMHINLDPKDFYVHSKDDLSSLTSNTNSLTHEEVTLIPSTPGSDTNRESEGDIMHHICANNRESAHHPLLGMTLVTLSAVCYAALNLSVKALMSETPWQQMMFIRMAITWMATLVWIIAQYRGKLPLCGVKRARLLLVARAFFLWGAMFTCWWSFEFLPVGDGTTLQMSFPVWVSVFAHFVWKNDTSLSQRLDLFGWVCVLAGLLGIVFVAQPEFIFGMTADNNSENRNTGIAIGIASAFCAGVQYVIVNYTKKDTHWLQVEQMTAVLSTFVFCPLGAVAFALYYYQGRGEFVIPWARLDAGRWAEEVALGLLGFCALALLTRGSQLDAPARTAICLYLQIPFVYLGQCLMTHSFPDVYIFVGIFLVLCSVIVPAIRKLRRAKKQRKLDAKLRHRKDGEMRKYSDSSYERELEETIPLMQSEENNTYIKGVTIDFSSEEESTGNTDIDSEDVYYDLDKAVL